MINGLMAALAVTGASMTSETAPIRLVTSPTSGAVQLEVVGQVAAQCDAAYELEVSGGSGGSNRSVQRGAARLRPGGPVTLAKVTLSTPPGGEWMARLKVERCNGPAYEEVRRSSDQ